MGYAEAITIGDLLVRAEERYGEAEALVFPDLRWTFSDLRREAERIAAGLIALGVTRGDRVGLLMPNCPAFVAALYGAAMTGAIVVPVNARFKRRELGHVLRDAGISVLLTSDLIDDHVDFVELLYDCLPGLSSSSSEDELKLPEAPSLKRIVLLGARRPVGVMAADDFHERAAHMDRALVDQARERVRVRDVAAMPYTSGTTAAPKGCLLTHEALVRQWRVGGERMDIRQGDRFWNPLPMFHLSGLGTLMSTVDAGAVFVSTIHFEAEAALEQIEAEGASHVFALFPPVVMGLLRHPDFKAERFRTVRVVGHVAPAETLRVAAGLLPQHVVQIGFFGQTECCGTVVSNTLDESFEDRITTVGTAHPGIEVRITDPVTGMELGPRERGEIQVRGYSVFEGYHGDPSLTEQVLFDDGWLRTGDLGTLNERGQLSYLGRLKDTLKVGGENVAPAEVEAHLSTHSAVKIAQVVGRPDHKYGEVPVAFIELVPGQRVEPQDLIDFCQGHLASWKVPREVRFVTEWPTSATKIQKSKLREQLRAETGAS